MVRAARPRAFHAVVEQVRGDIFAQRRRPGDRLPPEHLLSEQFGVSRTGVREAVRVLELQGLVEVRHGYAGGVFVAEPSCTPLLGALEVSLRVGQVSVDELYQARRLVEPSVTRLAVECGPEALAARLAENVARTEQALAEGTAVSALNREFHAILAEHADNRVLALMMQALQGMLESQDERYPNTPAVSRCALREHQQVLGAVRAGAADQAERRMRDHLGRLEERVRRLAARQGGKRAADVRSLPAGRGWRGVRDADDTPAGDGVESRTV